MEPLEGTSLRAAIVTMELEVSEATIVEQPLMHSACVPKKRCISSEKVCGESNRR